MSNLVYDLTLPIEEQSFEVRESIGREPTSKIKDYETRQDGKQRPLKTTMTYDDVDWIEGEQSGTGIKVIVDYSYHNALESNSYLSLKDQQISVSKDEQV